MIKEEELSSEIKGLCASRDVECCVIEVVPVDRGNCIVEVWVEGFGTAILEGNRSHILEVVTEILNEIDKDVVVCPICGHEVERRRLLRLCVCGAGVETEDSRVAGSFFSPALDELWGEAALALGLRDFRYLKLALHVDKAFENVFYVGRGITSWRTWFLKRPWRLSSLANLIKELHENVDRVSMPFLEEYVKDVYGMCREHVQVKPPGECIGKFCPFFVECVQLELECLKEVIEDEKDEDVKWQLEATLREAKEFLERYAALYERAYKLASALEA